MGTGFRTYQAEHGLGIVGPVPEPFYKKIKERQIKADRVGPANFDFSKVQNIKRAEVPTDTRPKREGPATEPKRSGTRKRKLILNMPDLSLLGE